MPLPDQIELRGKLTPNRPLDTLTWLRVGGPADWLFQPADRDDLSAFLQQLDPSVPVFPIGVGSNLIVRDGGIRGVVIRLGRGFNGIDCGDGTVTAGAAALDARRNPASRKNRRAERSNESWRTPRTWVVARMAGATASGNSARQSTSPRSAGS